MSVSGIVSGSKSCALYLFGVIVRFFFSLLLNDLVLPSFAWPRLNLSLASTSFFVILTASKLRGIDCDRESLVIGRCSELNTLSRFDESGAD